MMTFQPAPDPDSTNPPTQLSRQQLQQTQSLIHLQQQAMHDRAPSPSSESEPEPDADAHSNPSQNLNLAIILGQPQAVQHRRASRSPSHSQGTNALPQGTNGGSGARKPRRPKKQAKPKHKKETDFGILRLRVEATDKQLKAFLMFNNTMYLTINAQ